MKSRQLPRLWGNASVYCTFCPVPLFTFTSQISPLGTRQHPTVTWVLETKLLLLMVGPIDVFDRIGKKIKSGKVVKSVADALKKDYEVQITIERKEE